MRRRVWIILILLFGAGALLFWRPFVDEEPQRPERPAEMQPDFVAEGLVTQLFESDGRLAHRINATKMSHYSRIGLTELITPVYIVYPDDTGATWQVTAEVGSFYDDQTLVLERNVTIKNLGDDDYIDRIETSYLVIDMLAETMTTEEPVTIRGINFIVRGDGMKADLYAEKLELYKHVETIYYQPDQSVASEPAADSDGTR